MLPEVDDDKAARRIKRQHRTLDRDAVANDSPGMHPAEA